MSDKPRVALVTGAQQGIGHAAILAFAEAGYDVAINWLDVEPEALARTVRGLGRRVLMVRADVADVGQSQAMVAETVSGLGRLDVLVNNAGIFPRVPFLELTEAIWDRVHAVNLRGAAFCAQAAARAMIEGGRGGAIVNIASSAIRGAPRGAHYSASKSGLIGLTRSMALELAPHRIRVNAVAPGLTDTAQPRDGHSEEDLAAMAKTIPLGRLAQPGEIAQAILFLASEQTSFMTGELVHLNGGAYMA